MAKALELNPERPSRTIAMTPLVGLMRGPAWPAFFVVALALAACATAPTSPAGGVTAPRTAQCTQPGGWGAWTGGISASGSTAFCGQPRR